MKNNQKAFTLVELIVVITILSVLATIAFISFQGYAASARDSVRLTDLKSMEKVIQLYMLKNSKYPTPNNETNITFSWATAWTQWVFWVNAYTEKTNLSNVPTDPITGLPYAYSITNTKQEYQFWVILEAQDAQINTQTYAWDQIAHIYIKWDYNRKIIKVKKGLINYILWVPSIIASDINDVRLEKILENKKLVYTWYNNLPASYSWSIYNSNPENWFDFIPNQVILFEWDIDDLEDNTSEQQSFFNNLQDNYSGTIIESESDISDLLWVDSESEVAVNNYVAPILNNTLNTNIPIVSNGWITPTVAWCVDSITPTDSSYFTFDEVTGAITAYDLVNWPQNVVIPCQINGIDVTILWYTAFNSYVHWWPGIDSIILTTNITELGAYALSSTSLTTLTIPSSMRILGEGSIWSNSLLTEVIFHEWLETIWENVFSYTWLKNIILPDSLITIWEKAFYYTSLEEVTFGNSIETIWYEAFKLSQITSLTFPDSLTRIDNSAFENNNITEITFWNGLTSIWYYAFYRNSLTSLDIPSSLTTMDKRAFGYNSISDLHIPKTLTNVWEYAFSYNAFDTLTYNTNWTVNRYAFNNNTIKNVIIWNDVTWIWASLFNYKGVENITIWTNVETIGGTAFWYNSIQSITIPSNVTHIENSAFYGNDITEIHFTSNNILIEDWSFAGQSWVWWTVYWPSGGYVFDRYTNNTNTPFDKTSLSNYVAE